MGSLDGDRRLELSFIENVSDGRYAVGTHRRRLGQAAANIRSDKWKCSNTNVTNVTNIQHINALSCTLSTYYLCTCINAPWPGALEPMFSSSRFDKTEEQKNSSTFPALTPWNNIQNDSKLKTWSNYIRTLWNFYGQLPYWWLIPVLIFCFLNYRWNFSVESPVAFKE